MTNNEIVLSKICSIYNKAGFVKKQNGQLKMILKCAGLGEYYDDNEEYFEPYWYNKGYENTNNEYSVFLGLDNVFMALVQDGQSDKILALLTELGNNIPDSVFDDEGDYCDDLEKLTKLYSLLDLDIDVDKDKQKLHVKSYTGHNVRSVDGYSLEQWLQDNYQDVYESYKSSLDSYSLGDFGAAIESCRTALTGIFSKFKGVPFQDSKWLLGLATETGDFTGKTASDRAQMSTIKNEIEQNGKKDIADFFEENPNSDFKKTKAIYSIYSMLSDYGTHRMEGNPTVTKSVDQADCLMMMRMTTDILLWVYDRHK